MTDKFIQAMRTSELAPGGMKSIELRGRELVICNCAGHFYAIDRRCGHMNAPLDLGTLDGSILTCALHCAQFDVTTGEALSGPVPPYLGTDVPPPRYVAFLTNVDKLMQHVRMESIGTYPVKVDGEWVMVALERGGPEGDS